MTGISLPDLAAHMRDLIKYEAKVSKATISVRAQRERELVVTPAQAYGDLTAEDQALIVEVAAELGLQWQRGRAVRIGDRTDDLILVRTMRFFAPAKVLRNGPDSTAPDAILNDDARAEFEPDRVAEIRRHTPFRVGHLRAGSGGRHPDTFHVVLCGPSTDPRRAWYDRDGQYHRSFEVRTWQAYLVDAEEAAHREHLMRPVWAAQAKDRGKVDDTFPNAEITFYANRDQLDARLRATVGRDVGVSSPGRFVLVGHQRNGTFTDAETAAILDAAAELGFVQVTEPSTVPLRFSLPAYDDLLATRRTLAQYAEYLISDYGTSVTDAAIRANAASYLGRDVTDADIERVSALIDSATVEVSWT